MESLACSERGGKMGQLRAVYGELESVSKRMLPLDAMSRMPFDKFQICYILRHENTNILAKVLGYHVAERHFHIIEESMQ